MVIGLIANSSTTESLLNNLSEAEFELSDVSVIMRDPKARDVIADDAGPFKGVLAADLPARLALAKVSPQDAKAFGDKVIAGKVFVAIAAAKASEGAAAEMLKDVQAELIKIVAVPNAK